MEEISIYQVTIILVIVTALFVQQVLSKANKFKKVRYTRNQRLGFAIASASPTLAFSYISNNPVLISFAVAMGSLVYFKENWFVLKKKN